MLFKKNRIPRGYMVLEDIKPPKNRGARPIMIWLIALLTLFGSAILFSQLASAQDSISRDVHTPSTNTLSPTSVGSDQIQKCPLRLDIPESASASGAGWKPGAKDWATSRFGFTSGPVFYEL